MVRLFWFAICLVVIIGWWLFHLHSTWLNVVGNIVIGAAAFLALIVAIELVDGAVGQLVYRQAVSPAKVEYYRGTGRITNRTMIYLPGAQNSGDLTISQYLPQLRSFGNVIVVNYPANGFDGNALFRQILHTMRTYDARDPYVMGMSLGSTVGVAFMRWYQQIGQTSGPLGPFISICGPGDRGDIKSPLAALTPIIHTGPLVHLTYPYLQDAFFALGPKQRTAVGVDPQLVKEHKDYIRNFDARGGLEQIRFIYNAKAVESGEFPDIPALIIRTIGTDVLVKHEAVPKLEAAFPKHITEQLPGIHANLVEEYPSYDQAITSFLSQQFRFARGGSGTGNTNGGSASSGSF